MQGLWKRQGAVASFVVLLLAGSGCGPQGAADRAGGARARRRPKGTRVEEKVPAPETAEFEEPEEPAWSDVEPATEPEEEDAASAEEEEEGEAETPVAEEAEGPAFEDEGGEVEEKPAVDDWNWNEEEEDEEEEE